METGVIATWREGYGFIAPDDGDVRHMFFHRSAANFAPMAGMRVRYRLGQHNGRACAVDVRAIDRPTDFATADEVAGLFKVLRPSA